MLARVRPAQLKEFLGPPRYRHHLAEEQDEVGVATALAYTPVGGETMPIEVSLIPGRGELIDRFR